MEFFMEHLIFKAETDENGNILISSSRNQYEIAAAINAIASGLTNDFLKNKGRECAVDVASLLSESVVKGASKGLSGRELTFDELKKLYYK